MNSKLTKGVLIFFLILFAFLFALAISGGDPISFMKALGAQLIFTLISYVIYTSPDYKNYALSIINKKTFGFSVMMGIVFGVVYIIIANLFPGFSIGVPLVPSSISQGLRFFVVNICSPILESIFFFGTLLVILFKTNFGRKYPNLTIVIIGAIASLFHLGAYLLGLYDLSSAQAIGAFSSNLGTFISAFIFFTISGFLATWKKVDCLIAVIIFHFFPNFYTWIKYSITFSIGA